MILLTSCLALFSFELIFIFLMSKLLFMTVLLSNSNEFVLNFVLEEREKIPYKLATEPTLPGMVVFNIDELIWPFKVDKVMTPPLRATSMKNQIRDRMGKVYELFPEVRPILEDLSTRWYKVGGLVQSTDVEKIEILMNLYGIEKYFNFFEVFPRITGSKIKHIKRVSYLTKVPLEDILYFDANEEDLEDMKKLNVVIVYVDPKEGITYKHIAQGFRMYHEAKNGTLSSHNTHSRNQRTFASPLGT